MALIPGGESSLSRWEASLGLEHPWAGIAGTGGEIADKNREENRDQDIFDNWDSLTFLGMT
ncbi:MAG: hypothetical protein EA395_07875 [Phormidium sp. GEM2.Bin31]|nr:MAG: hypothetical protein EA395_07875 [Phormidium sp. GEM2.Bin31]